MSRIHLVCVLLFLGSLHAPSVNAADESDRKEQSTADKIRALTDDFVDAFAQRDLEAEMDFWHPDAYLSIAGIPLIQGREAIRIIEGLERPTRRIDMEYIELGPNDEEAEYIYVIFNQKWYNQEDKLTGDKKIISVWRNTADGYKSAFFMVNSNV